ARRVPTTAAGPAWRTTWPRNGDPKTWFRAMIQKCDAIPDDDAAAEKAHLPIEHLAELGCVTEALRNVNRFLRRLPRQEVLATANPQQSLSSRWRKSPARSKKSGSGRITSTA